MGRKSRIIIDEEAYALKEMTYGKKELMDKTNIPDIILIARYLYQVMGQKPKGIKVWLLSWLKHRDLKYKDSKWESIVDKVVSSELKKPLFVSSGIPITENELSVIDGIKRKPLRRLAFTMLCLAKYQNQRCKRDDDVVFLKIESIFSLSNTCMTQRQKADTINELRNLGIISPLMDDIVNKGNIVCFVDHNTEHETKLLITNMDDLGYQYERYCGEKFDECVLCGHLIRSQKGRTQKYCNNCKLLYGLNNDSRVSNGGRKLAMVKCKDCGCDFIVDPRVFGIKVRCDSCQKIHIKTQDRLRKRNIKGIDSIDMFANIS